METLEAPQIIRIKAKPYQSDFLLSKARYPSMVSGWATGKTMFGLIRALRLAEDNPDNLILIVRKDWVDLRDSTVKDFERYTGYKVDSNKEVKLDNGSVIMFRHGEEFEGLQNVNLGGFMIEQAEEFESDAQFSFLRGRLRRDNVQKREGIVIANANGHNWIWQRWILNPDNDKDFYVSQATTFDNADNLPPDYIADIRKLETDDPITYRRLVLNSHDEADTSTTVFTWSDIEKGDNISIAVTGYNFTVIGNDPAFQGNDENATYVSKNLRLLEEADIRVKQEAMATAGELIAKARKYNADLIVIDRDTAGEGIHSRLKELGWSGEKLLGILNGATQGIDDSYANLITEVVFRARDLIKQGIVPIPKDTKLRRQLMMFKYARHSSGKYILESKDKIRKLYKCSPDRAEAYCMMLYGYYILNKREPVRNESWIYAEAKPKADDVIFPDLVDSIK